MAGLGSFLSNGIEAHELTHEGLLYTQKDNKVSHLTYKELPYFKELSFPDATPYIL